MNILLYSATLPSYNTKKKKGGKDNKKDKGETINADDPRNKADVLAVIHGYKF